MLAKYLNNLINAQESYMN